MKRTRSSHASTPMSWDRCQPPSVRRSSMDWNAWWAVVADWPRQCSAIDQSAARGVASRLTVDLSDLLGVLECDGLMLLSDSLLPSLTSFVVGAPIGGSWWG